MALERRRKKDERRKKKKVYIIYACIACMLSYKMAVKTTGRREQKQKPEKPGCVQRTGILWKKKGEKGKSDTRTSNVVSHHRTNRARPCLTSEIGRERMKLVPLQKCMPLVVVDPRIRSLPRYPLRHSGGSEISACLTVTAWLAGFIILCKRLPHRHSIPCSLGG